MSTRTRDARAGRGHRRDGLARRLARRQQGGARPPLRRVGVSAPDARVRRRRRRDGAGRARPRALDLPGAQAARRRGRRRGPRRPRPPARAARRRAARLDGVHRREPARRRRADDVRGGVRGLLASTQIAQRARKILQEEGTHRVHAEAWARRLCRAGGRQRDALVARLPARRGSRPAAGPARTTTPASRPRSSAGWSAAVRPRTARAHARAGSSRCSGREGVEIALAEPADWSRWDAARGGGPTP